MSCNNLVRKAQIDDLLNNHLDAVRATYEKDGYKGLKLLLGGSPTKLLRSRGLYEQFKSWVSPKRSYSSVYSSVYSEWFGENIEKLHRLYIEQGYSALESLFKGHVARAFEKNGCLELLEKWKKEPHYVKPNLGQNPEQAKIHAEMFSDPEKLEELHQIYIQQGSDALSKAIGYDNIRLGFRSFNMESVWDKWVSEPHRTYYSFSTSKTEQSLQDWLEGKGIKVLRNQRFLPGGREIDLYLPEHRIGIEVNGVQFHLTGDPVEKLSHFTAFHPKNYHKQKTELALQAGVKLYHYWSNQNLELFKSVLNSKLGSSNKIFARTLEFRALTSVENADFFAYNHLDGSTISRAFGLASEDGTVYAAMSFRCQPRSHLCEIARFANLRGYQVVGGFSKLLKNYQRLFHSEKIVTYCNRDICPDYKDSVYSRLGFKFLGDTGPILRYWVYKSVAGLRPGVYDRRLFQKGSLHRLFAEYKDEPIDEFLASHEIYPIHNSGNWKFVLE